MLSPEAIALLQQRIQLSAFAEAYMAEPWYQNTGLITQELYDAVMQQLEKDQDFLQKELQSIANTSEGSTEIYGTLRHTLNEMLRADEEEDKDATTPDALLDNPVLWEK